MGETTKGDKLADFMTKREIFSRFYGKKGDFDDKRAHLDDKTVLFATKNKNKNAQVCALCVDMVENWWVYRVWR